MTMFSWGHRSPKPFSGMLNRSNDVDELGSMRTDRRASAQTSQPDRRANAHRRAFSTPNPSPNPRNNTPHLPPQVTVPYTSATYSGHAQLLGPRPLPPTPNGSQPHRWMHDAIYENPHPVQHVRMELPTPLPQPTPTRPASRSKNPFSKLSAKIGAAYNAATHRNQARHHSLSLSVDLPPFPDELEHSNENPVLYPYHRQPYHPGLQRHQHQHQENQHSGHQEPSPFQARAFVPPLPLSLAPPTLPAVPGSGPQAQLHHPLPQAPGWQLVFIPSQQLQPNFDPQALGLQPVYIPQLPPALTHAIPNNRPQFLPQAILPAIPDNLHASSPTTDTSPPAQSAIINDSIRRGAFGGASNGPQHTHVNRNSIHEWVTSTLPPGFVPNTTRGLSPRADETHGRPYPPLPMPETHAVPNPRPLSGSSYRGWPGPPLARPDDAPAPPIPQPMPLLGATWTVSPTPSLGTMSYDSAASSEDEQPGRLPVRNSLPGPSSPRRTPVRSTRPHRFRRDPAGDAPPSPSVSSTLGSSRTPSPSPFSSPSPSPSPTNTVLVLPPDPVAAPRQTPEFQSFVRDSMDVSSTRAIHPVTRMPDVGQMPWLNYPPEPTTGGAQHNQRRRGTRTSRRMSSLFGSGGGAGGERIQCAECTELVGMSQIRRSHPCGHAVCRLCDSGVGGGGDCGVCYRRAAEEEEEEEQENEKTPQRSSSTSVAVVVTTAQKTLPPVPNLTSPSVSSLESGPGRKVADGERSKDECVKCGAYTWLLDPPSGSSSSSDERRHSSSYRPYLFPCGHRICARCPRPNSKPTGAVDGAWGMRFSDECGVCVEKFMRTSVAGKAKANGKAAWGGLITDAEDGSRGAQRASGVAGSSTQAIVERWKYAISTPSPPSRTIHVVPSPRVPQLLIQSPAATYARPLTRQYHRDIDDSSMDETDLSWLPKSPGREIKVISPSLGTISLKSTTPLSFSSPHKGNRYQQIIEVEEAPKNHRPGTSTTADGDSMVAEGGDGQSTTADKWKGKGKSRQISSWPASVKTHNRNHSEPPPSPSTLGPRQDYAAHIISLTHSRSQSQPYDGSSFLAPSSSFPPGGLSAVFVSGKKKGKRSRFTCGVCFDMYAVGDGADVEECDHMFCIECLEGYIETKVQERRFPILCPSCVAENVGQQHTGSNPGVIGEDLVRRVVTSRKTLYIYDELLLHEFSVRISCRRCRRAAFVDREEYEHSKIILCPLPSCGFRWCKECSKEVERGFQHSCDGSMEFNMLIEQKGWKRCPGCKAPVQKSEGCNHMTCTVTGCNTHFCYNCGGLILKGLGDVSEAVRRHFGGKCSQYPNRSSTGGTRRRGSIASFSDTSSSSGSSTDLARVFATAPLPPPVRPLFLRRLPQQVATRVVPPEGRPPSRIVAPEPQAAGVHYPRVFSRRR